MTVSYEPEDILTYFLRSRVTEPTRENGNIRQTNTVETFDGDASTVAFTVGSKPLCCINSITVDAVALVEYSDFTIDYRNHKITFTTAPASGTDNISVDYDYGKNWIYPDAARTELTEASYPRISVLFLDESEQAKLGMGDTDTKDVYRLQIDIMASKHYTAEINSEDIGAEQIVRYLAREVIKAIKRHADNQIGVKLFFPTILSNIPLPFEEKYGRYRRVVDVQFETFNAGEA